MDEISAISAFIDDRRRHQRLPNGYAGLITAFLKWLQKRKVSLERLSSVDVSEYLAKCKRRGLKVWTLRAYLCTLRSFFRFAARNKLMPAVDLTDVSVAWLSEPGGYPSYRGPFRAVYERPRWAWILHRLPWAGDLEEDLKDRLAFGHSRSRVSLFLRTNAIFQRYLQRQGVRRLDSVRAPHVEQFLATRRWSPGNRNDRRYVIKQFLRSAFERRGKAFGIKKPAATWLEPELAGYETFRREHRGIRPATSLNERSRLRRFAQFLADRGIRDVRRITVERIDAFMAEMSRQGWCGHSLKSLAACLRTFFRYLEMNGTLRQSLAEKVGDVSSFRDDRRPKYLPWPKIQAFLKAFPRTNPADKRDYAIVLLVASYGLRAREVTKLSLQDLDFEKSRLNIPERKGGKEAVFPLRPEVEAALKAYLAVRPQDVSDARVFLRIPAPTRPLVSVVSVIVRRLKAFFGPSTSLRQGSYLLRHSFAKAMLDQGARLTDVGTVLGHARLETTLVYTRIHGRELAEVADNYARLL